MSLQPKSLASKPWPALLLASAAFVLPIASAFFAFKLLASRCEGFSCTYLGLAWLFWLGLLGLPATGLGFFAHRAKSLNHGPRRALRLLWQSHCLFMLGLLAWWLMHRA